MASLSYECTKNWAMVETVIFKGGGLSFEFGGEPASQKGLSQYFQGIPTSMYPVSDCKIWRT